MQEEIKGEIVIYKSDQGPELKVHMDAETVWLTQSQISELFDTDRTSVGRHIKNIVNSAELRQNSVCAIFAHTASDGKTYKVQYYNLDMVISIGYRVNSKRATQFRIWATARLKDYLLKGYAVNEKRLKEEHDLKMKELQNTTKLFQQVLENRKAEGYEKDLLKIITDYSSTWALLNKYDKGELGLEGVSKKAPSILNYTDLQKSIVLFKQRLAVKKEAGDLFGQEVGEKFKAVLGNIEQTFAGKALYPSLEEKAAHLFYFLIKDHPFADGNKRIGSLVFMLYLVQNNALISTKTGERKINDSALSALALLIAESKPEQKDIMVKLVVNLINK